MKTCYDCKEVLDFNQFHKKGQKTDGTLEYSSKCAACKNKYQRDYYAIPKNGDKQRQRVETNRPSRKRHGMTLAERESLKERQNYRCAICKVGSCEVIDHDHACCEGSQGCPSCVRGYLCGSCNFLLGHARDDCNVLLNAVAYLTKYAGSILHRDAHRVSVDV